MSDQELEKKVKPEELIQAEKFMEEGEFNKALKLLNVFDKKNGIQHYDKLSCYQLKGQLLIWQGKYKEVIKISEDMYRFSQLYDYKLKSIDSLVLLSHIYTYQHDDDKALNIIKQAEKLLKEISQESSEALLDRGAHLIYCKGLIFAHKGDSVRALEYLKRSLSLREEIGNKQEIAQSLYSIAVFLAHNGKFVRAFDILKRSLTLATESNCLFYVGLCLNSIGSIYLWKGKFNRGLVNYKKSLAIFKKINNKLVISGLFNIHDAKEAAQDSDVIYTDSWMSYGIPADKEEERKKAFMPFQVTSSIMEVAKSDAIFMNCLPAMREYEQTAEVIDGPQSIVFDQAENRLHIQKAIMLFLRKKF